MKFVKYFAGLLPMIFVLFFTQSNLSSCKKEVNTIRDTVIVKDTLKITNTTKITDTIYNLMDHLIAYYNFNGGNLNDSSGNNNHIVFNNALKATDRFGRANNAYLFDGSTTYMKVANSASLNPINAISLVATVKINDFYRGNCTSNQIFGKGWNDFINGFYVLRFGSTVGCNNIVDTSKEVFYAGYGNLYSRVGAINNSYYIHANIWYNVIYTYENGQSNLYVNGVLINTQNAAAIFTPNSQELYIGKHGDPAFPYGFNGVIDEIRIYNKALCEGEVKQFNNVKN